MQLKRHFRAGRGPREAVMTFLEGNPIGWGWGGLGGLGFLLLETSGMGGWEDKTESIIGNSGAQPRLACRPRKGPERLPRLMVSKL